MLPIAGAAGLGLLAGAQHAATGPDHLAGVAPFAAGRGAAGWRAGAAWGLGHATGALLAASVALLLRERIPGLAERLSAVSEVTVGCALVLVGALGLHAAFGRKVHEHRHGDAVHSHPHAGSHRHAPFWIGCLHGAAGLSHLFAVLPALALPGLIEPAVYLAGYAFACLATLTVFAGVLGRALPGGSTRALRLSVGGASAASLLVGLIWIGVSL